MDTSYLASQAGPLGDGVGDAAVEIVGPPCADSPLVARRRRFACGLSRRERLATLATGGIFLTAAVLLAVFVEWNRPLSWTVLAVLMLCYAVGSKVEFPVGAGWTDPSQIAFVPMLFLLPTALVPIAVAAALIPGRLVEIIRGRLHPERVVFILSNSWYSLAPAAIFIAAGVTDPAAGDWWIYGVALSSQVAFGLLGSTLHFRLLLGKRPDTALVTFGSSYLVDALLSSAGLLAVLGCAQGGPLTMLLVLPLFAVIELFARDRRARIEGAVELQNAYRGTAMLLGDFIEADHEYTGSHSRNVVELSVAVADALKLNPQQKRNVEFGALLHDIGKIAVPESIIDKAGPLNDAEWEIIKCHTIDGQRMLERVGGVLGAVGIVVRASHEHYDGRGYPDGLSGEDIPIEARIVSCCDAFSAMTTDRSYRSAMSHDAALLEVELHSGTQFDPQVAAALIELVRDEPRRFGAVIADHTRVEA